jgi:hypothetical protein
MPIMLAKKENWVPVFNENCEKNKYFPDNFSVLASIKVNADFLKNYGMIAKTNEVMEVKITKTKEKHSQFNNFTFRRTGWEIKRKYKIIQNCYFEKLLGDTWRTCLSIANYCYFSLSYLHQSNGKVIFSWK